MLKHALLLSQVDSFTVHMSACHQRPPYTRCWCSMPARVIQCGPRDISVAGRSQLMGGVDEAHIGQGRILYLETAHA
jgi:hypothetical protein